MILKLKKASISTLQTLKTIAPMLFGIIGLVGLFKTFITPEMLHSLFNGSAFHDILVGTATGGVSVGQPFISYIIGGEFLKEGVSPYGVTAFILSFVTLGVVQLPLEFSIFGARFTLIRNILSIIFAILISWITTYTLGFFQ